jgi:hypothetical protein
MDWLPADHLVYFLLDVVGEMDLRAIEAKLQCTAGTGSTTGQSVGPARTSREGAEALQDSSEDMDSEGVGHGS